MAPATGWSCSIPTTTRMRRSTMLETRRRVAEEGGDGARVPEPAPTEPAPATGPAEIERDQRLEPTVERRYVRFRGADGHVVQEPVIGELRLAILVDGQEIVQLMCSPRRVSALVLGFLYHEGIIDSYDDVLAVRVCLPDGLAEVRLARPLAALPTRRIITSGCTGGTSFGAYLEELDRLRLPNDDVRVEPATIYASLRELYGRSELYNRSGGVHTSILARTSLDRAGQV